MDSFPFKLPLILDGATGTQLMAAGKPEGVCGELWNLEHPEVLTAIQKAYAEAGSNAVYAPTFEANRHRLKAFGLENDVARINHELVQLTRNAVGEGVLVGGDMSITGLFIEPYGDATFDQLVDIFREQGKALVDAGVDFIGFETMMSLWECRAGLIATRDLGVPVFVSITVDGNGRTLMGSTLPACVVTLQELGAAAIGINCAEGPAGLDELFYRAKVCAKVPLIAKPNAGRPDPEHPGRFDLDCPQFIDEMKNVIRSGAVILGGCCGTGPEHIAGLAELAPAIGEVTIPCCTDQICANESSVFFLPEEPGDINLSEPIECSWGLEDDLIELEDERVNVAVVRVETEEDVRTLSEAAPMSRLPISVLCDDEAILDAALRNFHGRALVDSRSTLDEAVLRRVAERYGAIVF